MKTCEATETVETVQQIFVHTEPKSYFKEQPQYERGKHITANHITQTLYTLLGMSYICTAHVHSRRHSMVYNSNRQLEIGR